MTYAILSDIHANLEALQQCLADKSLNDCDKIICLGDIVGYGPFPDECVDLIRARAVIIIAGNHDRAIIGLADIESFSTNARLALAITEAKISADNRDFLQGLELTAIVDDIFFVHAAPLAPHVWSYILSTFAAAANFSILTQQVCFIGHSHRPIAFCKSCSTGKVEQSDSTILSIEQEKKYIINVGSVGQPRDGDFRAGYGIYNTISRQYKQIRVEYDYRVTQEAMLKSDLPLQLVQRLSGSKIV